MVLMEQRKMPRDPEAGLSDRKRRRVYLIALAILMIVFAIKGTLFKKGTEH